MNLWQDVRFAVRLLVKDRWFTFAAALALALGIGVNATVFTLVNAVLIRGLPFDHPDELVAVSTEGPRGRMGTSYDDYEDWRDESRSFAELVAWQGANVNISDDDHIPERVQGVYISWSIFRMVGEQPIMGRDFTEADDQPGAEPVVMLGYAVWQNRYAADPSVLGKVVRVNSKPATVIGVMARGMEFPNNTSLWIPVRTLPPESFTGRAGRNMQVGGRLKSGVTIEQARAEMDGIGQGLARTYPDTNKDLKPGLQRFEEQVNGGPIRLVFLSMMGAVGFVLLIACANVANLLLARAAGRTREIAIRISQGASRWRIVRQLLVESLLLATMSGGVGVALSVAGVRWFDAATVDRGKPYWMTFTFDPVVFAFVAAICVLTALIFGLAPALQVSKTDVNEELKEGGRSGGGMRSRRWTGALIIGELVLTLVLLSGAGFMMGSFLSLYRMDLGFDAGRLMTMQVYLPLTKYPQPEPRAELYQRLADRLAVLPSIESSALATTPPIVGSIQRGVAVDGRTPEPGAQAPMVSEVAVGDQYFETLRIPTLRGRTFARLDGLRGHGVAVVNQRFVDMHLGGADPIGRQVKLVGATNQEWLTVVGIVPNIRQRNPQTSRDLDPVVYVPLRSEPERTPTLVIRSNQPMAAVAQAVREEMRMVEPDIPVFQVQTMEQLLARLRWVYVVFGSMFAAFAGIALFLSAIGLYAVTAYSVTERTQEIGVRMALGAQPPQIMWMVLRRALVQLAIGLPVGLAGGFGVGRLLESVLVDGARNPVTLVAIAIVLIAVSVLACLWPARRAARLDPMIALRYE